MKSQLTKIVVALLVVGALAGCATPGGQEDAMTWMESVAESANTD